MDLIQNMILQQWEKAGGIYAEAARLARIDIEKEGGEPFPSPAAYLTGADWDRQSKDKQIAHFRSNT